MSMIFQGGFIVLTAIVVIVFAIRTAILIGYYRNQMRLYPTTRRHQALRAALKEATR